MRTLYLNLTVGALACRFFAGPLLAKTPVEEPDQDSSTNVEEAKTSPEAPAAPNTKKTEETRKLLAAPDATIDPKEIIEYNGELPRVKKLIESALALTALGLTYTASSADPSNGGMDCSGFTSYLLTENGFSNVPRDASGQYVWLRKAGTFRAVLSQNRDTFELNDLRPGDLLFWTGTYSTQHDPPVTHVMIYLGTERETQAKVMVGSSDGRYYHGKSRWGVSIFDLFPNSSKPGSGTRLNQAVFVGYGRPPGLRD